MHVTRLKHGYRIRLNDSEYAALVHLVVLGRGDVEAMTDIDWAHLKEDDPAAARGLAGTFAEYSALSVDEDRR